MFVLGFKSILKSHSGKAEHISSFFCCIDWFIELVPGVGLSKRFLFLELHSQKSLKLKKLCNKEAQA